MSEVKDYVSIGTEAATLFTNDSIKQYKGEDFEKVIINALLAIDYSVQGKLRRRSCRMPPRESKNFTNINLRPRETTSKIHLLVISRP